MRPPSLVIPISVCKCQIFPPVSARVVHLQSEEVVIVIPLPPLPLKFRHDLGNARLASADAPRSTVASANTWAWPSEIQVAGAMPTGAMPALKKGADSQLQFGTSICCRCQNDSSIQTLEPSVSCELVNVDVLSWIHVCLLGTMRA